MSSAEGSRRVRRSHAQWQQVFAEQAASGLGVRAFCAQHGLAPSSFRNWKRKLDTNGAVLGAPAPAGFVELAPSASPDTVVWEVELELSDGLVVRLRRR